MAKNFRDTVLKNLSDLVANTILSCELITSLAAGDMLSRADFDQLESFLKNGLHTRGATYIYTIVLPKLPDSHHGKFLQALRDGKNSSVAEFLHYTLTGSMDFETRRVPKRALEEEMERRRALGAKTIWGKPVQQSDGRFNCFCTFIKEDGARPIIGKATRVGKSEAENAVAAQILEQLGISWDTILEPVLSVRVNQRSAFPPMKQGNTIQLSHMLWYYPDKKIRSGVGKTTFKGYLETPVNEVAVQKVKRNEDFDFARTDKDFLLKLDHQNLVKVFFSEQKENHIYTVMELADFSLVGWLNQLPRNEELVKVCKDAMTGLNVLHEKNFVHGNITPESILIFSNSKAGGLPLAKICDFEASLFNNGSVGRGTAKLKKAANFFPPEIETEEWIHKPSYDIFTMGLVLAFTMTGGKHLFSWHEEPNPREIGKNILDGRPNWNTIDDPKFTGLKNLLQVMLSPDPKKRSEVRILMEHPFFWSIQDSIKFIVCASHDVKKVGSFDKSVTTESEQFLRLNSNWMARLDPIILKWIKERDDFTYDVRNKGRLYRKNASNGRSIEQLIHLIRDLDEVSRNSTELEEVLGYRGSRLGLYFMQTFPELTTFLYNILQSPSLRGKATAGFYEHNRGQCFQLRP